MLRAALAGMIILTAAAGPALAAKRSAPSVKRFDGTWSVEVITETGTCDRAYRYGLIIQDGQARYAGGSDFTITGRVQPNGVVRGAISRGDASAQVVGRLANGWGNGTWTTSGGTRCGGRWNAERRG
ncbi:conserved hypothetical protein [Methylobacterium sp. 4-46]|uniref:hypothetical protein n=1 Tax=unclassified Methylobacterium TaxID=2615210 RepID=UPI000152D539|nr:MULTISPECIES: hypothetical protein [Methylobacterium]ACA14791.1 conserved hypothetical protein [Methylobacterium sp. 4-46]WFT83743.1 hypothetical protein QA634_01105 [Methylobacterium nodulans]